jgi:hypothetical protein
VQSAKTTKPGTSPGSITNLHCPSLLTRFKTFPETSTAAPTAKDNLSRANNKSEAFTASAIAFNPNLSILNLSTFSPYSSICRYQQLKIPHL